MSVSPGSVTVGLVSLICLFLGSALVLAQNHIPLTGPQGSTTPSLSTGPAQPASTPPDTAIAGLAGPPSWPQPVYLTVLPDTVHFGGLVTVVVDFPAAEQKISADQIFSQVPWLIWADAFDREHQTGIRGLWDRWFGDRLGGKETPPESSERVPPPDGTRIQRQARVFRTGPYRLQWQDDEETAGLTTGIRQVASGLAAGDEPLGVRHPRSLGWRWPLLLAALLVVILVIGAVIWLRRQARGPRRGLEHNPVPPPAYLAVAQQLWKLHCEELPARGEGRRFLDRLAALLRGYLRDRFRIGAEEMTAGEILTALRHKGYRPEINRRFASVIEEADILRYAPERVSPLSCDELLARTVALMDEVRVVARYTSVPADLAVAGDKSWGRLTGWLRSSDRLVGAALGEET